MPERATTAMQLNSKLMKTNTTKAVGGPKEQHRYFTSHEFNDTQSRYDRREGLTKELGLHDLATSVYLPLDLRAFEENMLRKGC